MRRTLAALAVPLLLVTLVACGPDSLSEGASDVPATADEQDSSDGGAGATPAEETSEPEETEETETPEAPRHTAIETTWVDESWAIEDLDEDLCAMGITEASHSEQDDMFLCGPTAAGAEACAIVDGNDVLCIVDLLEQKAIRFASPSATDPDTEVWPADQTPVPLFVELSDGAICSTISHDHEEHWDGMFSWFRCDDGSELLTPESIDDTFARGDIWQVRRSVDKAEPQMTDVVTATFAGR